MAPSQGQVLRLQVNDGYWQDVAGGGTAPTGTIRRVFLRAEEVQWNYAPLGYNVITNARFSEDDDTFVRAGGGFVGSTYTKCVYHGYTDASYATRTQAPPEFGILGPPIYAEVGDDVHVTLRNSCSFPATVHAHGVFYSLSNEGAPGLAQQRGVPPPATRDDAVAPGGEHTFVWSVGLRAGPGPADGSSMVWLYHSHVDEAADTYTGLAGPLVVTKRGMAHEDGSPKDVDREVHPSDDANTS